MSSPERRRARGFTLLELVLALLCTGLLVGALVTIWIQVIRTASRSESEALEARRKETTRRQLQQIVSALRWTPTSHLPQGALAWNGGGGSLVCWSGACFGAGPGPVRWEFRLDAEGLQGQWQDPTPGSGVASGSLRWEGVESMALEALRQEADSNGERVNWVDVGAWDPGQPFRPVAFRFRLRWKGEAAELCVAADA